MDEHEEQEHWTVRRQRAVRCKIHGLHYDPKMTSGCSLCRKEGIKAQPRSRPQLIVFLLALLGLAVVGYRIFGPGGIGGQGFAAAEVESPIRVETPEPSAPALDPEQYREQLEALEKALFEPEAEELAAIGDDIVAATIRLTQAIRTQDPQAGRATADAIAELGRAVELEAEEFTLNDLEASRATWSELRLKHFGGVSWFLAAPSELPPTDPAALVVYRSAIDELLSLVSEGSEEARTIAGSVASVGDEERDRRQEQWEEYARDWRQRLDQLQRRLPERPSSEDDAAILLATQKLEEAFTRVRALATDADLPNDHGFAARFDEAVMLAERARGAFDDLLRI